MILYFAPGSGAGHLNRALAVCLELRKLGIAAEIVTNSPFAAGVARIARFPIVRIADHYWMRGAREYLERSHADLAVVDALPAGLRGEWVEPVRTPLLYMARRLRLAPYIPAELWPRFIHSIEAEPLDAVHRLSIAGPVTALSGPVRLAPGTIREPVPPALEELLDRGGVTLVIHSGVETEVRTLIDAAPEGPLAVVSPWEIPGVTGFDYYPAGNLLARAGRVITGAGYNSMADMLFWRERHTAIPFERTFDDQAARVRAAWYPSRDGTAEAARIIADHAGR